MCVVALLETNALSGSCLDHIDCDDSDSCTYDLCVDGNCMNTPALYGDVVGADDVCDPPDGRVSLRDIIAVLDGIFFNGTGDFTGGCPLPNLDLAGPFGCGPDGAIDVFDLIASFDAFNGSEKCCDGCCSDIGFCNGTETCVADVGCRIGSVPCPG